MLAPIALPINSALGQSVGAAQQGPAQLVIDQVDHRDQGTRLSQWLIKRAELKSRGGHASSLSWPHGVYLSVREAQLQKEDEAMVRQVLTQRSLTAAADPAGALRLLRLTQALPFRGRIPLQLWEPEWLEVNPDQDPVLSAGDRILTFRKPIDVVVVLSNGQVCRVAHQPDALVAAYVQTCRGGAGWWERLGLVSGRGPVWLVKPSGRVRRLHAGDQTRFGDLQTLEDSRPEAGSWIWAPDQASGFGESFSWAFTDLLASQGPADDYLRPLQPEQLAITSEPVLSIRPIASDWGSIGLIQMPTARMAPDSELTVSVSRVAPYRRTNIFIQPMPWMEFGFRYTDIEDRLYGAVSFSGDQTLKDKSIDTKFRLLEESDFRPDLSVGFIDVGGTGLFSSEYLVATKQFGSFDLTGGLAWGYLGQGGSISNPLGAVKSSYKTRQRGREAGDRGGNFAAKAWFTGPMGAFGGIQWQTPWPRWTAKLEYEANNHAADPSGQPIVVDSRINLGLTYAASKWADLSVAFQRGNQLSFAVTLHAPMSAAPVPKVLDPKPLAVVPIQATAPDTSIVPAAPLTKGQPDWSVAKRQVQDQTQWQVDDVQVVGDRLIVDFVQTNGLYVQDRADLAARVFHRHAPSYVREFAFNINNRGLAVNQIVVDRDRFVSERSQLVSDRAKTMRPSMATIDPISQPARGQDQNTDLGSSADRNARSSKASSWKLGDASASLGVSYSHHLGGPDGFWLYQIGTVANAEWRPRADSWLAGTINYRLIDNYESFKINSTSQLPQVRTLMRQYYTTSRSTIPNLQMTHVGQLQLGGGEHFYSVYGGYLEWMFGGVGAEYLWRPWNSRYAVGVDINRVQQREFDQKFDFRDYKATTGHITGYWDTGWNGINVQLKLGQYLAQDQGATLNLSRVWPNGVTFGIYATKTDVSAAQFGEGSFDKGVYLTIPFDAMLPKRSTFTGSFIWQPITRDGGAILGRRYPLYDLTNQRSPRTLEWGQPSYR